MLPRYVTGWLLRKEGQKGWLFFHTAEAAYQWKDAIWRGEGFVERVSHFDTYYSLND